MMKIFKLTIDGSFTTWDDNDGMAIIACDEDEARLLASEEDNGRGWWLDPNICKAEEFDLSKAGVVLISNVGA